MPDPGPVSAASGVRPASGQLQCGQWAWHGAARAPVHRSPGQTRAKGSSCPGPRALATGSSRVVGTSPEATAPGPRQDPKGAVGRPGLLEGGWGQRDSPGHGRVCAGPGQPDGSRPGLWASGTVHLGRGRGREPTALPHLSPAPHLCPQVQVHQRRLLRPLHQSAQQPPGERPRAPARAAHGEVAKPGSGGGGSRPPGPPRGCRSR